MKGEYLGWTGFPVLCHAIVDHISLFVLQSLKQTARRHNAYQLARLDVW